jgi:hypothetical protein
VDERLNENQSRFWMRGVEQRGGAFVSGREFPLPGNAFDGRPLEEDVELFIGLCELTHVQYAAFVVRGGVAIVRRTEVIMPTVKQLVVIAVAIAMAIVGASAFGIGAAEHSATQVGTSRFTPAKADFRLNDHQRLKKMLLGKEGIELPLR